MTKKHHDGHFHPGPHYRWIALSNTTLGMLAATLNASILLISLPAIFRGITSTRWSRRTSTTCCG